MVSLTSSPEVKWKEVTICMHGGLAIPRVSRHSVGFSLKGLTHQQSLLLRVNIYVQALPPGQESRTLSKEALTCPSRPLERCSVPGFILLPAPPLLQHPGPFSCLPSNKYMLPCKAEGEETVVLRFPWSRLPQDATHLAFGLFAL